MGRAWGLLAVAAASSAGADPRSVPVEDDGVFVPGSLEKVAEGYNFTEGPAWDGTRVIFSDISGDTVYAMVPGEARRRCCTSHRRARTATPSIARATCSTPNMVAATITRWTPEGGRRLSWRNIRASISTAPMMWWCVRTG